MSAQPPHSSISATDPEQVDAALLAAWELFAESASEQAEDQIERLLPVLVNAGYAEQDEGSWAFTGAGIARHAAITRQPSSHCHFCGSAYTDDLYPRQCPECAGVTYRNPLPVPVAVIPVLDHAGAPGRQSVGLLLIERLIAPVGLALPGGYLEATDPGWQTGLAREVKEESGLTVTVRRLIDADSVPGGHLLLFAQTAPVLRREVEMLFEASDETSGYTVLRADDAATLNRIVFDKHRDMAKRFFDLLDAGELDLS